MRGLGRTLLESLVTDALREADPRRHDHANWFFAQLDKPRWLGHTLAYRLVGVACDEMSMRPSQLVGAPAHEFRGALERLA